MANKANLLLWVQALESGRFHQGRERLKHVSLGAYKYCCLGVACEVAIANGVAVTERVRETGAIEFDGKIGYLPEEVQDWLGIPGEDPALDSEITAAQANDGKNMSFIEIAALVRQSYGLGPKGEDVADAAE